MISTRYRRSLAPSDPKSVPDYLNREHQKLETTLDDLRDNTSAHETSISALQTDVTAAQADITALQTFTSNQQAAIANDASGALNQATVNAILAALRAYGIIAP